MYRSNLIGTYPPATPGTLPRNFAPPPGNLPKNLPWGSPPPGDFQKNLKTRNTPKNMQKYDF